MKSPNRDKLAELIAKAMIDQKLKERLLNNPKEVLKEIGGDFSENEQIKVFENTKNALHFVVPKQILKEQYQIENISQHSGNLCTY